MFEPTRKPSVALRYGTDPNLGTYLVSETFQTSATNDFTKIIPLTGLTTETTYYMNFYASQLFTNPNWIYGEDPEGDVVKIPFASPATHTFLTDGALSFTGGVAVGPNGAVYVADGKAFVSPGAGRIVRLGP